MNRSELTYLHVRMICGPAAQNRSTDETFHGEIEKTLVSVKESGIIDALRSMIDTMQRQGEFLVAALVVVQIEGDPDTDLTQFDYRAGNYTGLVTGSGRYQAANHIIELLRI